MANRKDLEPSVATFADHEVITPPHRLRKVVRDAKEGDGDPVARADAALARLSSEFGTWMNDECDRLEAARHRRCRAGNERQDARRAVSRRA